MCVCVHAATVLSLSLSLSRSLCDLRQLVEELDTDAFGRVRVLNHPHVLRPRHMELRV
jgi:hypothetical protein